MKNRLLKGVKDIMDRFSITEDQFYVFLGLGMPVRKINGRWYAHESNIDEFFREKTQGKPVDVSVKAVKELLSK